MRTKLSILFWIIQSPNFKDQNDINTIEDINVFYGL